MTSSAVGHATLNWGWDCPVSPGNKSENGLVFASHRIVIDDHGVHGRVRLTGVTEEGSFGSKERSGRGRAASALHFSVGSFRRVSRFRAEPFCTREAAFLGLGEGKFAVDRDITTSAAQGNECEGLNILFEFSRESVGPQNLPNLDVARGRPAMVIALIGQNCLQRSENH